MPCNECHAPESQPVGEFDVEHLGDENKITIPLGAGGVAEAILTPMGIILAKSVAKGYFRNLSFCATCRARPLPEKDPFTAVSVLSLLGFGTFILFLMAPAGWLFFGAAGLILRSRLRTLRENPTATTVRCAIQALGTFFIAVLLHTGLLLVYALVFYKLTRDPGFKW